MRLASEALAEGIAATTPCDLETFPEALSRHGTDLLRPDVLGQYRLEPTQIAAVPQLPAAVGFLNRDHVALIVSRILYDAIAPILRNQHQELIVFLDWFQAVPVASPRPWAEGFRLPTKALVPLLTRWVRGLVDDGRFPWASLCRSSNRRWPKGRSPENRSASWPSTATANRRNPWR